MKTVGNALTKHFKFPRITLFTGFCVFFCLVWAISGLLGAKDIVETKIFAKVAKNVSPAVVGISAEKLVEVRGWMFEGVPDSDQFERFFGERDDTYQRKQRQTAQGSGFVITSDGYILTNDHVVGKADKLTVKMNDARLLIAEVIGSDPDTDVALIKVEAEGLKTLELADSDKIEVGEWVLAVGSPFGLSHTVTAGIVSAKGRSGVGIAAYEDFIQTDAAINFGNSGGPLVNLQAKVVGINTAIISPSGANLGIGLAIPSNMVKYVYRQLRETGKVVRGYIGVIVQDLTPELAKSFGLKGKQGVLIPDVLDDSPAHKGGLKTGDIVISLNDAAVANAAELRNRIAMIKPGSIADFSVLRNGEQQILKIEIGKRAQKPAQAMEDEAEDIRDIPKKFGIEVQTLTEDIARRFGYEGDQGVVITRVMPASEAESKGLMPGMLIKEVNRKPVKNAVDFALTLKKAAEQDVVVLLVNTGEYNQFIVLQSR